MKAKISFKDGNEETVECTQEQLDYIKTGAGSKHCNAPFLCAQCPIVDLNDGCANIANVEEIKDQPLPQKLEVGDWVRDILTDEEHEVFENFWSGDSFEYPLAISATKPITSSGKEYILHKYPRFILVRKAKKKVMKNATFYLCIPKDNVFIAQALTVYANLDDAKKYCKTNERIATFGGQYEVEE